VYAGSTLVSLAQRVATTTGRQERHWTWVASSVLTAHGLTKKRTRNFPIAKIVDQAGTQTSLAWS
jgi:hypothetical protein